jgi:hypothetical protein
MCTAGRYCTHELYCCILVVHHRKVVMCLTWLESDWFTCQVVAPVVSYYAHAMAWLVGNPGVTFSAEVCWDS